MPLSCLIDLAFAQDWPSRAWALATVLIGLVWLRRHLDLNRGRQEPVLRPVGVEEQEPSLLPKLSVLVAAKDEEENIESCLTGLLAQDYPDLEVIAIDDRSTDRTGAIIDGLAQRDPRLRPVHVHELRPGWFGKPNAMREGMTRATGQWLCFSDADCTYHSRQLLTSAVRYALREKVDFLSVLPHLEARSFWERVVQPVAGAIMVFWNPPQRVNDPASSCAYANGAFMLISRQAYERMGGHEPVRATLNEDMHLARRCKQLGLRLRVIRSAGMYSVRMYTGLRAVWRGWSRIFYGCLGTWKKLTVSMIMLAVFSISPYVTLLVGGIGLATHGGAGPAAATRSDFLWPAVAAGLAVLAQQSVLWRFYGLTGNHPVWALTYPLGAVMCLGMTASAMLRLGGAATTWRGTAYRGGS